MALVPLSWCLTSPSHCSFFSLERWQGPRACGLCLMSRCSMSAGSPFGGYTLLPYSGFAWLRRVLCRAFREQARFACAFLLPPVCLWSSACPPLGVLAKSSFFCLVSPLLLQALGYSSALAVVSSQSMLLVRSHIRAALLPGVTSTSANTVLIGRHHDASKGRADGLERPDIWISGTMRSE